MNLKPHLTKVGPALQRIWTERLQEIPAEQNDSDFNNIFKVWLC